MLYALILQDPLDAFNCKAGSIEEMLDAFDEINIVGAVITPPTAAL